MALPTAAWGGVPPSLLTPPLSQTNYTGETVVFAVAAGGDEPLQYQWQRNNTNLTDGVSVSGSTTSNLTLVNISTSDYGTYSVTITNAAGATNASATLTVFTRLVQNGGFETGSLAPWSMTGNTHGFSVQSTSSGYVHSGDHGARIGPDSSLGYLAQTIPTSTGQVYEVSFWLKNNSAEPTNEFAVWWNGNPLYDQGGLAVFDWTNLRFRVTATTTNTALTFGFQNDESYFGLDDVSVLPVPACQTVPQAPGSFAFTFNALAGFQYQVESATNLSPAGWSNDAGVLFSETNAFLTTAKPTTFPRHFYRLAVLP